MSKQVAMHLDGIEQDIHEHAAALEIINRVNLSLAGELDLENLAQAVIDAGTQVSGAELGAFFLYIVDPEGENHTLSAFSGERRQVIEQFPIPKNTPAFEQIFRSLDLVRSDDITRDARYAEKSPLYGMLKGLLLVRSYLAVPVISRSGAVNGGLFFGHSKAAVFGAQVEKIIAGIAAHVAVAIDNARRFERLRRSYARGWRANLERDQAQLVLRESEERFRLMANSTPAMIWTADPSGAITFHNQRWLDYTGIGPEVNVRDWPARVVHPDDVERCSLAWAQALEQGTEYEIEVRNRRHDGEYRWFLTQARPVRGEDGRIIGWFGSTTDIHDRKLAEEALRESEERFARFMQQLPGLAWIKDIEGRYVYANQAAATAFQTPRERLYGKTDHEIFPAEVAEQFIEHDRRALASGTGVQVIETLEHADGVVHHSIVSKFPILGPGGQPALIGGMAIDITERQQVAEALRESEERFRRLVSIMPSAMFTCDAEGLITFYNRSAARLWGREPKLRDPEDRFCGSFLLLRTDETVMPHDQCPMAEAVLRGIPARNKEIIIKRPDGTMINVSVNIDPLYNEAGIPAGAINVFQDITARKQAEAEQERLLAELDKERAQLKELAESLEERVLERTAQVRDLASALALAEERERFRISQVLHDDLQQLIYSQLMRLELLEKKLSADQKDVLSDLVPGMKEQMTQAIHLTRSLAAELTPPDEAVESLGKGLEWLARQMQEAHGLNVTLNFNGLYDSHCGETQGLLLQIVRELLFNVVKHAGTDRALLELKRQDGLLEVSVQDGGVGFDIQAIQRGSKTQAGFGLLSISDRLHLLGGRLDIESAPAAGTRVTISVPVRA